MAKPEFNLQYKSKKNGEWQYFRIGTCWPHTFSNGTKTYNVSFESGHPDGGTEGQFGPVMNAKEAVQRCIDDKDGFIDVRPVGKKKQKEDFDEFED